MPPEPIKRDGAGNILTDNRSGSTTTYTYNNRNRLLTATSGALVWGYTYNAREQLVRRNLNVGGTNLTHFVHDIFDNVIAETNGTAAGTTREYIWLPETEIAPTYQSKAQVDRPVAVVDGLGGPLLMVHVDHLNRPVKMTNAAKASVWDATWQPWGGAHSITGTAILNARFPGQWFQSVTCDPTRSGAASHKARTKRACTTTGTGRMIRPSAGIRSPILWASSMGRVCMGMRGECQRCWWTRKGLSLVVIIGCQNPCGTTRDCRRKRAASSIPRRQGRSLEDTCFRSSTINTIWQFPRCLSGSAFKTTSTRKI